MQRILNYGSFLQAYGLKKILEQLNCEVQFVDYHPGIPLIPNKAELGLLRNAIKTLDVIRQDGSLKHKLQYIRFKKNYASNYYQYLGITNDWNYDSKVDVLIIGSDEVFNCVQNNTKVGFSSELFGQNHNSKRLVSYAASFGDTTLDKLTRYGIDGTIATWLTDFDSISVRDSNSGQIVKALIGREPLYHLDPVLIYDYLGLCSEIPPKVKYDNYLILYGYSGRFSVEECKKIRLYANNKGLKIICLGGVQACCDMFIEANPFEIISYFNNADCVVTDTFHGTIFSVITHSKFVVISRENGYGNSQKITDLCNRIMVKDRCLSTLNDLEMLDTEIDYKMTDSIIQKEREKAIEYLRMQIGF